MQLLHEKYKHFPLFTHGIVGAPSERSTSRQTGDFIEGVASSF